MAEKPSRPKAPIARLTLDSARDAIASLRKDLATRDEATALFGKERGEQLGTILAADPFFEELDGPHAGARRRSARGDGGPGKSR